MTLDKEYIKSLLWKLVMEDRDFQEGGYLENMKDSDIVQDVVGNHMPSVASDIEDIVQNFKETVVDEIIVKTEEMEDGDGYE